MKYEPFNSDCYRFFFILSIGFYYLIDKTEKSIRPRYMETVEESLNDTAHLFAVNLEEYIKSKKYNSEFLPSDSSTKKYSSNALLKKATEDLLSPLFTNVKNRKLNAKIYSLTKTRVDLEIYVTDSDGIVVYDSAGYRLGLDFSKYNDVYLTMQNKYGARSSKMEDPNGEGGLYVAAPIQIQTKIIGVITIVKPKSSVGPFIDMARKKYWNISILVAISIAVLFVLLTFLLFLPIRKLSSYLSAIQLGKKIPFPKINIKEIRNLGFKMDELIRSLEGKEYIESYVQTLTHEIKSPLSSIIASAELLESNSIKKENLIQNIQTEGKRIQSIIENLLELASLESTKEMDLSETVNIVSLINDLIEVNKPSSHKKSVTILTKFDTNEVYIQGNKFYLSLAIQNLLQNALDFSTTNNKILIIISNQPNKCFEIEIIDEGIGIPEYAIPKLYDRFFSLPRPDTGKKSSGLGLAFVKEIIRIHHGEIYIENSNPKGVSAKIKLKKI
ncbi:two-component system sensor histidine kinase CreC [Leptospira sp. 96542]|nr:two-component system sensor histidine kinase CreC [Leptospira sp. 96542]